MYKFLDALCRWFGYCHKKYDVQNDPVYVRWHSLDQRVDVLWHPREFFDV